MSMSRIAALLAGLTLMTMFANAASRNNIQIKVLDSETRALSSDDNGVPSNCEQVTFDAYCRSSRTAPLVSTLLVQEGNDPPFRIRCTIESKFSRCTPLSIGESYEARREKRGIVVYYVADNGKVRSQLYTLVEEGAKSKPAANAAKAAAPASVAPTSAAPANAAADESSSRAPAESSPPPAESSSQAPAAATAGTAVRETVKCSFGSTPAGAEVTIDGRYVGSTPSVVGLTTGTHIVVVSMAGFEQWKRELAVTAGSELTVNAVLQKVQ